MADALVSTPVALGAATVSAVLLGIAGSKIKKENRENLMPLMGVTGAFVFAAQMINFAIPGTGSSGHIIGGVLLASVLGPWAAFLTLASVLIVQCLLFADGGLMALGCNILNMGAMTTLVAYPLVFRPLMKYPASTGRMLSVSSLACIVGLELGAVLVTAETELSGITALSFSSFLALMTSIHLSIGLGEGLATGAVLIFVQKSRPSMLYNPADNEPEKERSVKSVITAFAASALVLGGIISFFASSRPDGLEWAIEKMTGSTELEGSADAVPVMAEHIQNSTALLPDYENPLSGIIGGLVVLGLVWAISAMLVKRHKPQSVSNEK